MEADAPNTSSISFPKTEENILKRWRDRKIFQKSLDPKKKAFSFYDGPPFATGLPHYGHLLASTLKDVVPRYWSMRGYHIERKWGWDCHGLPIEQEIDKKHQFKSSREIEAFGIAKYNAECRGIVLRFTEEWKRTIERLGRWVDMENDYKTMDLKFMESVWWVMSELWKKGLIYRGYKVMPFSTPLGTPLSNFEASSNYMDVQDPALTITFPIRGRSDAAFLAWTTTPWTLPANLALAVGDEIEYAEVKSAKDGKIYVLADALVPQFFKKNEFEILSKKMGKDYLGVEYEPLFDFYADRKKPYFTVLASKHVTTESGTGIVHTAPAHGQEDFDAARPLGIDPLSFVDASGNFGAGAGPYAGLYVKEADKKIIGDLKAKGRLFKQDTIQHAYAFCPRTDTPLISRAVASWFVKVEAVRDRLVANNLRYTHWVPEHLREGRFGKWLENARDWAISRNRYWGNPLPFFEAFEEPEDKRETFCIGSVKELEDLTGKKFTDIHREHLDDLIIVRNGKKFRRVPEVLDCWFESGAMPYAQSHYPFENRESFEAGFPAQFIAEGLDQTRGWFYTLSVLGTILFDKPPFQNVIVNGIIVAEDGKKMSKRLKNYPDPQSIMDQYGADALRLYLIDSPVIRGDELRFSEAGVKEIVRRVLLKWWNAYSFYDSYAKIDGFIPPASLEKFEPKNILDRWVLSRLQSLLAKIEKEMEAYHLYNVVPALLLYIEELTNTYIRLNRPRFWSEGFNEDKQEAFTTLYSVLMGISKMMAPFTPFLADHLYGLLTNDQARESVHLEDFPRSQPQRIHPSLESGVEMLEEVLLLARNLRDQNKVKVKVPLKELTIVHRNAAVASDLKPLENYLISELNVKRVTYRQDEEKFVTLTCKANGATLGPKAGAKMGELNKCIAQLKYEDILKLDAGDTLELAGVSVTSADVKIFRNSVKGSHPVASSSKIIVALDISVDRNQELEGLAREIVNRIQKLRKDSGLHLADRIQLQVSTKDKDLEEAVKVHSSYIQDQTLGTNLEILPQIGMLQKTQTEIDGKNLDLGLKRI